MEYKKIRRKILVDEDEKMCTLYYALCKYGTHGATPIWFFEKPEVNKVINVIVGEGHGFINENNLRYRPITSVRVTDIRESDGFIFVERF